MNILNFKTKVALCGLIATTLVYSCKKDIQSSETSNSVETTTPRSIGSPIPFITSTTKPYTQALAESDFTTIVNSTWKEYRADVVEAGDYDYLRVKMNDSQYAEGGLVANFNINDDDYYEVTYKVRFPTGFHFGEGGKLGFGFGTGNVWTGENNKEGTLAPDGLGGSARMMWKKDGNRWIFKPYLYFKDMPVDDNNLYYGTEFGATPYPSGGIVENTWYTVKMRIKSNTDAQADGQIKVKINGTEILNKSNIKWGFANHQQISELLFHTFRGGATTDWLTYTYDFINYDDVKVTVNPTTAF